MEKQASVAPSATQVENRGDGESFYKIPPDPRCVSVGIAWAYVTAQMGRSFVRKASKAAVVSYAG